MEYQAADADAASCFDVRILFPEDGIIRVESAQMFADADGPLYRRFVARSFQAPEIEGVLIAPAPVPAIELQFDATQRGIGASVVTNNVAALGALANGLWPMRKVAQLEAERRDQFEIQLRQSGFLLVDGAQPAPVDLLRHADPAPVGAIAAMDRLGTLHPYRELAAAAD